jgi:hypothetical protein
VEFYERVRQALKPDGVFSTWLSVSEMSEEGLEVVLAALAEVFERCDLRVMRGDYYMATCSSAPLAPRAYSALGAPRGLDSILAAGLTGLDLDRYFEDVRLSENLFATGRPTVTRQNTDDDPVLEYMIVRNKRRGPDWRSVFHEDRERFGVDPTRGLDPSDRERFAHRAEVFRRLATAIYRTDFAPVLRRDTLAAHAHRELLERTDGE